MRPGTLTLLLLVWLMCVILASINQTWSHLAVLGLACALCVGARLSRNRVR